MFDLKSLKRKAKSRSWLSTPEDWREDADMLSPTFKVTADELWMLWIQVTDNSKRIVAKVIDEDAHQSFHVQRTPYLRFPDEVRAQVLPVDEQRSSIAVYSQSRYGIYDLGVNRLRVERWLRRLDRRVMAFRRFQRRQLRQKADV